MTITRKEMSVVRNSQALFVVPLSGLTDAGGGSCVWIDGVVIWTIRCWGRKPLAFAMVGGGETNVMCRVEAGFSVPARSGKS